MRSVTIHLPNIPSTIEVINGLNPDFDFEFTGTSYREWGEKIRTDCNDVEHIIVEVTPLDAEYLWTKFGKAGVPVNATLTEDWSSNIVWGRGNDYQDWTSFFKEN